MTCMNCKEVAAGLHPTGLHTCHDPDTDGRFRLTYDIGTTTYVRRYPTFAEARMSQQALSDYLDVDATIALISGESI